MSGYAIPNWLIVYNGYLRNFGNPTEGMPGLYRRLWHMFPGVNVVPLLWDSNPNDIAEEIYRMSKNGDDTEPRVMMAGYSWGAGYGCIRLARQLKDRGVEIEAMILADAVYHFGPSWTHGPHLPFLPGWRLGIAQPIAYWPWLRFGSMWRPTIQVPTNVKAGGLHWYIQQNSYLRGHELMRGNKSAENRYLVPNRIHHVMDECPEFQAQVIQTARKVFQNAA